MDIYLFIYLFLFYMVYSYVKSCAIVKSRKCGKSHVTAGKHNYTGQSWEYFKRTSCYN